MKVVQLHKEPPAELVEATPTRFSRVVNAEDTINRLRLEMYNHHVDDLAESIGKSRACLYAIRAGRTKWPRGDTFFQLADFLGFEVHLVKK